MLKEPIILLYVYLFFGGTEGEVVHSPDNPNLLDSPHEVKLHQQLDRDHRLRPDPGLMPHSLPLKGNEILFDVLGNVVKTKLKKAVKTKVAKEAVNWVKQHKDKIKKTFVRHKKVAIKQRIGEDLQPPRFKEAPPKKQSAKRSGYSHYPTPGKEGKHSPLEEANKD